MLSFMEFEATEGSGDPGGSTDAGAAEAGADPASAAAPELAGGEAADAPSSGEPAAPTWAGPSQDEYEALIQQQEALLQWASEQQNAAAQDGGQPSDEQLIEALEQARYEGDVRSEVQVMQELQRRAVRAELDPVMPTLSSAQAQQAEQAVTGWLNNLGVPADDHKDVALFAHGFLPRDEQGNVVPGHGQAAAKQAAEHLAARDARMKQAGRAELRAELDALSNAPVTPGGAVAAVDGEAEILSTSEIARRFVERQRVA